MRILLSKFGPTIKQVFTNGVVATPGSQVKRCRLRCRNRAHGCKVYFLTFGQDISNHVNVAIRTCNMNWFYILVFHGTTHSFYTCTTFMKQLQTFSMPILSSQEGRSNSDVILVLLPCVEIDFIVPDVMHFISEYVFVVNECLNYFEVTSLSCNMQRCGFIITWHIWHIFPAKFFHDMRMPIE